MSTPARSTTPVLIRKITRRNPFAIEKLPLIARIFRWPFDRFSTPGRQALFGAPSLLAFSLYRRFVPVKQVGVFKFKTGGRPPIFRARSSRRRGIVRRREGCCRR
jgi:hypothetical protein